MISSEKPVSPATLGEPCSDGIGVLAPHRFAQAAAHLGDYLVIGKMRCRLDESREQNEAGPSS